MTRRALAGLIAIGMLVLAGCTADPPPTPTPDPDADVPAVADPLPVDELEAFGGVATMNAGSNCTGTLIDTGVPTGPAYVITNGHCVGDIGRPAQQTTVGIEWGGTAEFFRAAGNLDTTLLVDVVALAYSTMRHTDTAIVRLEGTLGDLEAQGVRPIPLAEAEPAEGAAVTNIGVPVQGLPDDEWVMRRGECTLGSQHTLTEFFWLWFDAWSNDCPGIIQGSSGSPLLTLDDDGAPDQVVAVINTTTWGARLPGGECWLNRPCEVTADGSQLMPETSYAQSVAGIGRCFDASTGEFALGGECPLPDSDVWAERGGGSFRGGDLPDAAGVLPEVTLAGREAGEVRTALVPMGDATACTDPATYADAAPVDLPQAGDEPWSQTGVVVPVELPETEGRFLLCAVRADAYAAAASVLFAVDHTPPVIPAGATVEYIGDAAVAVHPHFDPPELSRVRFTWGSADTVDCDDTAAFQEMRMVPPILTADELPAVFCVYALDQAGNSTPIERIDIDLP